MSFLLRTCLIARSSVFHLYMSFLMLHVEMQVDASRKTPASVARDRKRDEREKTKQNADQVRSPKRSARLGTASTSSSPSQKGDTSPSKPKKKVPIKPTTKVTETQDEETAVETHDDDKEVHDGDNPPDYKDRVVSYTNSQNRPALGNVGEYSREEKAYEVTFTYSDDLEPKEHVDYCPQHWVEKYLVDSGTAAAWTEAVEAALDGSKTSRKTKNPQLPDGEKRKRISTTLYKPHENTPNAKRTRGKKKKTSVGSDLGSSDLGKDNLDASTKALLAHTVREAVYDIRPHPERLRVKPFMYWDPNKKSACVKMLLKRSLGLQALAKEVGNDKVFCHMWADEVRKAANNERSMQKRQLKQLFLNNSSEYALVSDYEVASASPTTDEKEMGISKALSTEFETVQDLRKAIASPKMYTYPLLFELFCAGLESGKLRSTKPMPMSRIEQVITLAHEAHFRSELWFSLRGGNFSHDTSKQSIAERHGKFGEFCRFVNEDRHDNADKAFENRNAKGPSTVNDSDSDDDSNDGVPDDFY